MSETRLWLERERKTLLLATSYMVSKLTTALLITCAVGWSLPLLGKIGLLATLNVFATPLLCWGQSLPWWVYFLIGWMWLGDWYFYYAKGKIK